MGLTPGGLPYPEQTDSVDVSRDIKALGVALDQVIYGVYITANADGATGTYTFAHKLGVVPTWVVATCQWGGVPDAVSKVISVGVQSKDATNIQLRFRRDDTHDWFYGTVFAVHVAFGLPKAIR